MPRYEGNTPSKNRGHHKTMHSARHGNGVDAKLKMKKRVVAEGNRHYKKKSR